MRKKVRTWDEYEKELFKEGRISEEKIMIERMKMHFAKLLYDCRMKRNLTQRELADKVHVQQQYIAKIESGEENLTLETIGKLLVALQSVLRVEIDPSRNPYKILKDAA